MSFNDALIARGEANRSANVLDAIKALQDALADAGEPYPFVNAGTLRQSDDGSWSVDLDGVLDTLTDTFRGYLASEQDRIRQNV